MRAIVERCSPSAIVAANRSSRTNFGSGGYTGGEAAARAGRRIPDRRALYRQPRPESDRRRFPTPAHHRTAREVTSAGTLDLGPAPALPNAIEAAARCGLDISAHRAHLLTDDDLREADLVLGFERRHIVAAVLDHAGRRELTFTLPELADLLNGLPSDEGRGPVQSAVEAVERAHRRRHGRDPSTPIELPDPVGQSQDYFRDTCHRLRSLSLSLATGLFGSRVGFPRDY